MDDETYTCELCGEDFTDEEITSTFYWQVCDACKDEQEAVNWEIPT